jgi:hypothetical protein
MDKASAAMHFERLGCSERTIRPHRRLQELDVFTFDGNSHERIMLFSIVIIVQSHCISIQDYLEDVFFKLSKAAQRNLEALILDSPIADELTPESLGYDASATCIARAISREVESC